MWWVVGGRFTRLGPATTHYGLTIRLHWLGVLPTVLCYWYGKTALHVFAFTSDWIFHGAQFCSWQCFVSHTARVFSRAAFGFGRCMSDRDALNPAWARHARTHGIAALVEIGPIAGRHSLISQYDDDTYICR